MVIDSGFRCHLSDFARATAAAPSAFVSRLRKYLKTRRVTSVAQIGTDRIIEFQFSDGQYKLFLEFYAGGNIVLTDNELNILALLRIVGEGQDQEELRVGLKYSLDNRQNYGGVPPLTKERVKEGLQRALDRNTDEVAVPGKKLKKKAGDALRKALATSLTEFPPMLVDHALRVKEFNQNTRVEEVIEDHFLLDRLMDVLAEADRVVQEVTAMKTSKGYIIAKIIPQRQLINGVDVPDMSNTENEKFLYEDFHPFRPRQFENIADTRIIEFEGFNKTVDEFFSSIEAQKLESRLTEREEQAKRKLEAARQDHQKRVGGLQQVQELNVRKAQAIEANLQRVQEAVAAVNSLIAQGMDWVEIARLIEMEQAGHNPVAEMIKLPLKLYENTITLLLGEADFEEEEDDEVEGDETGSDVSDSDDEARKPSKQKSLVKPVDKRLAVDVDLALSPWSNARQYYDQKKTAAVKEQKTLQSSAMALKNTERKVNADLKKGLKQEKEVLRPVRKQSWFEKFYYFISSDGYLVLGGRDAQQNELLYRRHLKKGDVYVHADLPGAASIVVKNKPSMIDSPIPPSTLSQAGTLAVSSSTAWDSKAVMAGWWVNADQVSKTASTGEYLPTGSFTIKGKKNFLLPAQLILGFGVMFQISEESKTRHLKHRLPEESSEQASGTVAVAIDHSVQLTEEDEDAQSNQSDKDNDPVINAKNNLDAVDGAAASDAELENEEEHDGDDEDGNADDDHASQYHNPLQSSRALAVEQKSFPQNGTTEPNEESDEIIGSQENSSNSDNAGEETEDRSSGVPLLQTTGFPNSMLTAATASTRQLTNNQRQLLGQGQITSQPSTSHASDNDSQSEAPSSTARSTASKPSQLQPRVRGKHGQRLKQKSKYAHQDEEDRALALRLLGSTTGQEKAKSEVEAKAAREAELAAQKERRREQHLRAQQAGKEAEELRRLNLEEGIDTLDEDEVAELSMLDNFVGTPLPGDKILDALVMCGPWDAMGGKFRWRVKLQPGTTKKGKAVREILGHWGKSIAEKEKRKPKALGEEGYEEEKLARREGELLKGLKEGEVVGVIPVGRLRVAVGGSAGEKSRAAPNGKGKRGGRGSKKTK